MKFEDTILDQSLVQGYYQVGNKFFNQKLGALIESNHTNLDIKWNFHQELYQDHANKPRMEIPLTELYRQRALQLREKYDYLILAYSGGADSDQMLRSFVLNGIHLDEVWCDWPHKLVEASGWRWDGTADEHNIHMEYLACVKPTLDWLAKEHPEIKIHQSDSFAEQTLIESDDDCMILGSPGPYTGMRRYQYINQYTSRIIENGTNACVVMGIDKCFPHKIGNDIGFYFRDSSCWVKSQSFGSNRCIYEYFYWTPDFPSIPIEQAHAIWDILKLNPEQTHKWLNKTNQETAKRGSVWFDDVIKYTCYPNWDRNKFQVPKTAHFNNKHYGPTLAQYQNERFYQAWAHMVINSFVKRINPKTAFRDGRSIWGEVAYHTIFIKIGTVNW